MYNILGEQGLNQLIHLIKTEFDKMVVTNSFKSGTVEVTEDNTSSVTIPITLEEDCSLLVYHNGLLLTEHKHYTYTGNTLNFVNYTADAGDIINFMSLFNLDRVHISLSDVEVIDDGNGNITLNRKGE